MFWFRLRIALIASAMIAGLVPIHIFWAWIGSFMGIDPIRLDALMERREAFLLKSLPMTFLALAFTPLGVAAVIGFQSLNPLSDDVWKRPTPYDNPFCLGNPLMPFHFCTYLLAAHGIGSLIGSVWNGMIGVIEGFFGICSAVGFCAGVHLAMHLCKNKIVLDPQANSHRLGSS